MEPKDQLVNRGDKEHQDLKVQQVLQVRLDQLELMEIQDRLDLLETVVT